MGWIRVSSHRGAIITGSRSVRWRSISKEAEPAPRMTAARSTTVGTGEDRKMSSTSLREPRWVESSSSGG